MRSRDFSRLTAAQREAATKQWFESASRTLQYLCPQCGIYRNCLKTEEAFVYECETCGHEIDERLHFSRRQMSYWDQR